MAGNGGTMAEARQKLKKEKRPGSKTNQKANNKERSRSGEATGKRKTKIPARGKAEQEQAVPADGAEELKRAADREVGQNSLELAEVLRKKAMKGDLASVKLLVTLAAQKKPVEKAADATGGQTLAERWEAEPPWTGPLPGEEPGPGTKE